MLHPVTYYKRLQIKKKLFLILFILILTVSILSLFALQISYRIYDEELINQSSVILNLYSTKIESVLRKLEQMTFSILSDSRIQEDLKKIKTDTSSYERYTVIDRFLQRLMTEATNENYISSIGFIDTSGYEYVVGRNTVVLEESRKNRIIAEARDNNGRIIWVEPSDDDNRIVAAREIRSIENMESLAILIIRIDLEKLISSNYSMESKYQSNLVILSADKTVFTNSSLDFDKTKLIMPEHESYSVKTLHDKKFLIHYGTSDYTNWTYVNLLPYENIFQGILTMRTIMITACILLSIGVIFLGMKFADGITRPISSLSRKMKKVEQGDFNIPAEDLEADSNRDEIGQLEHNFAIMVNKINTLINENYIKQLLVKETELKALQSQINPHFLYNTLASIHGLAKMNGQEKISTMVKSLGNLLRSSVKNNQIVTSIDEELHLLEDYITIQKLRYGDRLDFCIEMDDGLKSGSILKLTLQPIVENSINYGLESLTGVCSIHVKGYGEPELIRISITDNGPGMDEETLDKLRNRKLDSKGLGIGLKNIDERIKLFFGEQYGLDFESKLNEGTTVNITLPRKRGDTDVQGFTG
jgi:two-component system sensor histidine kinase YesM